MSRIGSKPISIPEGVKVEVIGGEVMVVGPNGELKAPILEKIAVEVKDNLVVVTRKNEEKHTKSCHGLIRSLINNHIIGVTQGYKKTLKLVGTGYRVTQKGKGLSITLGFSHPVEITPPEGVELSIESNDTIYISGIDKQLVGQVAADIRAKRPPEPYKGKGVRYEDEIVRRKAGKAAA